MSVGLDDATLPSEATEATEAADSGDLDQSADPSAGEATETPPDDADASQEGNTDEPGEDAAEEAVQASLRDFGRDQYGDDTSAYASDPAYFQSLVNAKRLVGRRNDDATIGKLVRNRPELLAMLQGGPQAPASEPEKPVEVSPLSQEQLELLRHEVLDPTTRAPREDADPQKLALLKRIQKQSENAVLTLAQQPEKFFEPIVAKIREEAREEAEQAVQQQASRAQYDAEMGAFSQQNPWIYAGGKRPPPETPPDEIAFSPAGETFRREYQKQYQQFGTLVDNAGNVVRPGLNDLQVMQYTLALQQANSANQRQPTLPAKRAAKRKSNAAVPAPGAAPEGETFLDRMDRENQERIAAEKALA